MDKHTMPSSSKATGFLIGNLCILIAAIFWGVNVSAIKALIPGSMSANGVTAVRLIGACVLFWIVSLFVKNQRIIKSDWVKLILGGFIGLFGFIYLFVTSLRFANPIDVSIIMTLPPVFVILIGVCFLHRRPSVLEYIGVAVSFVGAFIVIWTGNEGIAGPDNLLGDLIAVASTVCYAFYLVILEKPTATYHPVTLLRWVFLFGAIPAVCLLPGFQLQHIFHSSAVTPWVLIGFVLLCPTFIAYFLVQPAIKSIGSELVSIYQYLVPVFATISAVLMRLDHLRWTQVIAMAVIVFGMVMTNVGKRKRIRNANSTQKNIDKILADNKKN